MCAGKLARAKSSRAVLSDRKHRTPVCGKTPPMPAHDGLRPDDGYGIKDVRATAIKPNEQRAVDPTQMQSTPRRTLPKNVELMSQYQDFGLQPPSRLEAVAQHADEQEADCNHAAIMF